MVLEVQVEDRSGLIGWLLEIAFLLVESGVGTGHHKAKDYACLAIMCGLFFSPYKATKIKSCGPQPTDLISNHSSKDSSVNNTIRLNFCPLST